MQVLIKTLLKTPFGMMVAISDESYLYLLKFIEQDNLEKSLILIKKATGCLITDGTTSITITLEQQLNQYFNGTLHQFTIPTNPIGTDFQKSCWQALLQVPYGATMSYDKQAIVMGNRKAFRAVANANKHNPIAIIIPCHRIIKSNGDLCGYNGGVHRKQRLLALEQRNNKSI